MWFDRWQGDGDRKSSSKGKERVFDIDRETVYHEAFSGHVHSFAWFDR